MAVQLNRLIDVLERIGRSVEVRSKFVDLAPTDQADKAGVYADALLFATNNPNVSNIAITGPYGSGKSSIVRSFLTRYRRPALQISLAAFLPEADTIGGKVSRQEIERSILQQMLYGADANKLPLSRFKRIKSPGVLSVLKSLVIISGIVSSWYLFAKRDLVISGEFFEPFAVSNWINLSVFALAALFVWAVVHYFYVASFGVSLKSISLKDIEIRPASEDQESILNRHLDEIIYFFQSTKYDLVVIEDLDRFNNSDIFVTLREINSLVNKNAGVRRAVRFLYALRDDMFVNTDRTKFFEFIIPVIPIINKSNSIDMVLEQGRRLALDQRLDQQFLREVSRYLNDLRLIHNIFNEYAIYVANLETDGENVLDANKLLAVLIYKNVYPRDFERLHRGEGDLADILSRQDMLIANGEAAYRLQISRLEQEIEAAEAQIPLDLRELRQIYAMALVERLPAGTSSVSLNGQTWIQLPKLVEHESFEELIEAQYVTPRSAQGIQNRIDVSDIDPDNMYCERKAQIEQKAAAHKSATLRKVQDIRSKISSLRTTKFSELLRLNLDQLESLFVGFADKGELARFLILEGHLDDTYYQYTSLFHSGRLSPNDNKFLIQIRAFVTPDPDFPIDNPSEVVQSMREEDFRQSYVLNVKLVDFLLTDEIRYAAQTQKLFDFVASDFEACGSFFDSYYAVGREVPAFLWGLANAWDRFPLVAIASSRNIAHITQIILHLPEKSLEKLAREVEEFSGFVVANLEDILALAPELAPERLELLGIEVEDLAAIGAHSGIVRFMFEKGLFDLSVSNLEYIYQTILGKDDLGQFRQKNYTTLRSTENAVLLGRIKRDFDVYLSDVLLKLNTNSNEDASAILDVLRHDELGEENMRAFLGMQKSVLMTLEGVPERFHAMLFQLQRIEPTWENCIAFMNSKEFDGETLIDYLDREDTRRAILKLPLSGNDEEFKLRKFLIEAGTLGDAAYQDYVRKLPKPFAAFPDDLEQAKVRILIQEGKITFTKESFDSLAEDSDSQVLFAAVNIGKYLAEPDTFAIDDEINEELLRSEISDGEKRSIIALMDLSSLPELPERAALIGPILARTDAQISNLDATIARSLILNSTPVATQISLFNQLNSTMSEGEVRELLAALPRPFSEITTGYHTPRLPKSDENLSLVQWLDARDIISSWSEGGGWFTSEDLRVNLYRR